MCSDTQISAKSDKPVRHIVALSGGKDSSALAVYMRGKVENLEYVFCDTGEELDETYEYIHRLQDFLGSKINWLKSEKDFRYYVDLYNGVLPDPQKRWCTRMLKIKPYEDFIGDDPAISYVGIRADEPHRKGLISTKSNIKTVFPFVENNIRLEDVERILRESGLGVPRYYEWRSRSGCYFCFFQQKREWIGLLQNHPKLFEEAKKYEKFDPETGERYTWNQGESLDELANRADEIMEEYARRKKRETNAFKSHQKLKDVWGDDPDDYDEYISCNICHL
jgi:3'-phosphoadenosine 5'-phosphosulfate sulfotransferase (PAPS reductase)/FAD synthetase